MNPFSLSSPIINLFECWPETVYLFIEHQMACPGCYLAKFESLEGALQIYQIEHEEFLPSLHEIIADRDCGESLTPQEPLNAKGEPQA
jgi:hybrid cluster-associated redox disulfide protein